MVGRARARDERAIAQLYRLHQPALARYLRARVASSDVDDLAQQVWIDALRNIRRFSGGDEDWRRWLFTIARRRLVDHLRRAGRGPATEPLGEHDPAAGEAGPEHTALQRGDDAARRIAELLPADQADVVLLRVVAGLDVAAVAKVLGKRSGHVRVLQHRALRRLAEHFDPTEL